MRALITGISGFVGSHLAEYLLRETDWQIGGTVFGDDANIAHLRAELTLYPAELSGLDTAVRILEQAQPDYVFHLAAQPLTSLSRIDPWATLETNIRVQLNLLEAIVHLRIGCRFLVVGSSEEYGRIQPNELPVREETPLRPLNPYAVSKIAQDYLAYQYFLSHHLPIVRLRPFNHIGPRQGTGFVVSDFAKQIAEAEAGMGPPVLRVGNLSARRDFSDVRDIVRGYALALERGEPGEVYNLGSERSQAIQEVLDILLSLSRIRLTIEPDPARLRPSDTPEIRSDCSKFRARTGWHTTYALEASLRDVLDYWRSRLRR